MIAMNDKVVGRDSGRALEKHFSRMTCAELDAADLKVEFLVDRTLVAGQPCIIAGAKKAMKTSLVVDLGISLATGEPFLGVLEAPRAARVGIMSGESGMATIQESARRIATTKGHRLANISGLVFSDQVPQLERAEDLDAMQRFLMADELEVLFIDPTYMAMGGDDAGNLFKQGRVLRRVSEVCQGAGCTLILVHHTKKNVAAPFHPPELEDIAWAGFQEFARQWLLLGRREAYEPGTGTHRLWMNVGGSVGHSTLWALDIEEGEFTPGVPRKWEVAVKHAREAREDAADRSDEAKEAKEQARLERDMEKVRGALAKYPAGETCNILKHASSLHTSRFKAALDELIQLGEAVPCQVQKGNQKTPYEGYKPEEEETQ